ncbi:MAG TPA: NAD-dependent epimerase/dehydratase family protein [Solirubrobacterales bacterium]|nr:NAD-dependent epimerase/dehydratase family protein [Solirubrobacterales bacterium]
MRRVLDAPPPEGRASGGRQGRRTLVIGCGFIGSNVATQIASGDEPPVVLTRSRPSDQVIAAVGESNIHLGDAGEVETVEALLDGIEHVAFCAGGLLPSDSEQDPERDRELTLKPVRAVLEALRRHPGATLTYLSSGGTVYGEPKRLPVPESAPTAPGSAYGKLHLACEEEIERARLEQGLRSRILRCSTVYGEHQRPERGQGAIVTFLYRIARGEQIDLYGDGTTIRDYIYVGDVARAVTALIAHEGGPPVVNVGSGEATSLVEVLAAVEKQVGRSAEIVRHPERGFDVHQIVLDTSLLHETVELEITTLGDGVERTSSWLTSAAPKPV